MKPVNQSLSLELAQLTKLQAEAKLRQSQAGSGGSISGKNLTGHNLSSNEASGDSLSGGNLKEVAQQFESLFTHMLLKNMRSASLAKGVFDSDQSKMYQDMFDQQLATELSSGRGLGIAELLVQQLGGGGLSGSALSGGGPIGGGTSGTGVVGPGMLLQSEAKIPPVLMSPTLVKSSPLLKNPPVLETLVKRGSVVDEPTVTSPIDFVKHALPHAIRVGKALGVAPRIILAQAALESGWGQHPIRNSDGSDSHNLFGIKATGNWSGKHAVVKTLEFVAGLGERVTDAFRSYQSMAESF